MFDQNDAISVYLIIGPHRVMLCLLISRHFFERHLFSLSQEIRGFNQILILVLVLIVCLILEKWRKIIFLSVIFAHHP